MAASPAGTCSAVSGLECVVCVAHGMPRQYAAIFGAACAPGRRPRHILLFPIPQEFPQMTKFVRNTLATAVAVAALASPFSASAIEKLTTEREKVSYMVGMDLSKGLMQIKDEIDLAIV